MMKILKHCENYQKVTQKTQSEQMVKTGANRPAQGGVATDLQLRKTGYLQTTTEQSTIKHGMSAERDDGSHRAFLKKSKHRRP